MATGARRALLDSCLVHTSSRLHLSCCREAQRQRLHPLCADKPGDHCQFLVSMAAACWSYNVQPQRKFSIPRHRILAMV